MIQKWETICLRDRKKIKISKTLIVRDPHITTIAYTIGNETSMEQKSIVL